MATVLVCALAVWAASIGPDRLASGGDPAPRSPRTSAPLETPAPAGTPDLRDFEARDHPLLTALMILFLTGWAVVIGGALLWWARAVAERSGRSARPPPDPEPTELDLEALSPDDARAVVAGVSALQRSDLDRGSPRNAIVACWHRFEAAGRDAGIARAPWETSAEYTLRILDRADPDSAAVTELAALFREARFSDHELGESARDRAREALARIHAGLGVGGPR